MATYLTRQNQRGKGRDLNNSRNRSYTWAKGKATKKTRGRGKGAVTYTSYESDRPGWKPEGTRKSAESVGHGEKSWKKTLKDVRGKTYVAGGNILDREKALSYDEAIKAAGASADPRTWQFHYKDPGEGGRNFGGGGKGEDNKALKRSNARRKAEKMARMAGDDVYQIRKLEWEAASTRAGTAQSARQRQSAEGFGSTRTARAVRAQKMRSSRMAGRSSRGGRSTQVFETTGRQARSKRIA